ncbi:MAG: hypothetical protein EAZ99_18995 [Alphaproteobacteria bacterium]|nr:MAG: hypothetical protein EAZ99_18995 [Alphaproteobacteria bacterium]
MSEPTHLHPSEPQFTDAQLTCILEQSGFYACLCPASVARQALSIRQLAADQAACLADDTSGDLAATHHAILATAQAVDRLLQDCLDKVLTIEGWDRTTLTMPDHLRERLMTP